MVERMMMNIYIPEKNLEELVLRTFSTVCSLREREPFIP
jgi:hypothetical protein